MDGHGVEGWGYECGIFGWKGDGDINELTRQVSIVSIPVEVTDLRWNLLADLVEIHLESRLWPSNQPRH